MTFIVSCSNDDSTTQEEESINTVLRPSKVSKGSVYWLYEYDEDRVVKVEKYNTDNLNPRLTHEFNYDNMGNLTSIDEIQSNGVTETLNFTLENGLVMERAVSASHTSTPVNESVFTYNSLNQIIHEVFEGQGSDFQIVWTILYDDYYTYDENNNLVEYERIGTANASDYVFKYFYDDKNHPFKNIDARCRIFLKLPNHIYDAGWSVYNDYDVIAEYGFLDNAKSSYNNRIRTVDQDNFEASSYTLIYNEQDYPIEMQPGNGSISQRIYIEY